MKNGPHSLFNFFRYEGTNIDALKNEIWAKIRLSPKMHTSLESLLLDESEWILAEWQSATMAAKYIKKIL